ncbi:hypothetical protein MRB53_028217 [Persea americana]|uniref:Uncharacterized protein n=1 Tax=Persea americana TaxID=3435 RepID=A0ACC2KF28_PERAE|nr:hypothetical protein MRB53_028217 [Persea americana]
MQTVRSLSQGFGTSSICTYSLGFASARERLVDLIRVMASEVGMTNEDITQVVNITPSNAEKMPQVLDRLPGVIDEGDVFMFASRKATVDEIELQQIQRGFKVAHLHGDKDQSSPIDPLQKLKSATYHVLIATDIAACWLNIKSMNSLVNFDAAYSWYRCIC